MVSRWNRWAGRVKPLSNDQGLACSNGQKGHLVNEAVKVEAVRPVRLRKASCASFILQHYHSTGCAGGAFSWRAAMMDPDKDMYVCAQPREYRQTTIGDIQVSKADKRRGGGPRVGPFQETIPGDCWHALPKYDFTTKNRSSAFNERMHVEWENHADHILANNGQLPAVSVVAKAGFRSCAPCCRDMLALARPTGKAFIMVDLAEDDARGTFHFVAGDKYLPVPKEACDASVVGVLKKIVLKAQSGFYTSSDSLYHAVLDSGAPVDETAQSLYLNDRALLPASCSLHLRGDALLEILHAEHFARLSAEYGAAVIRDASKPHQQHDAILRCRARAKELLIAAWMPHLQGVDVDLEHYASQAVAPLLPEDPAAFLRVMRSGAVPRTRRELEESVKGKRKEHRRWATGDSGELSTDDRLQAIDGNIARTRAQQTMANCSTNRQWPSDDCISLSSVSTAAPPSTTINDDASSDGRADRTA